MKHVLIIILSTLFLSQATAADPQLQTATAELREIPQEQLLDGMVEAVNSSTLTAQTQGQVVEILVDVDEYVKKDSLIIRLRDTEQKARLDQAKADLNTSTARLEEIKKQHERIVTMYAKNLVSGAAMDQANANLKAAGAQHEAAQAGLKAAEEQLEYTRIRAPFSGIVTQRHIEVGETAHQGQKLMSGLSLDKLRVNVDVPQNLIPAIRKDQKARIILPDGNSVAANDLTIFPYAQSGSNTFKVRLNLPKDDIPGLFPGMYVKAAFQTGAQKRLLIPQKSVVFRSEVTAIYVLSPDGQIGFRHIRKGHETKDKMIEVLAGLDPGEKVALDPVAAGAMLKAQPGEDASE